MYTKICLGVRRIHKTVDEKYLNKSKNSDENKIMICGIHYSITKFKNEN